MMRERDVEKRLRLGAEERGGYCRKWKSPGYAGVTDRIVIIPRGGPMIHTFKLSFVEVKAPGEKPTNLQVERIRELQALGQHAGWVGSYEDVDRFLLTGVLNEV